MTFQIGFNLLTAGLAVGLVVGLLAALIQVRR